MATTPTVPYPHDWLVFDPQYGVIPKTVRYVVFALLVPRDGYLVLNTWGTCQYSFASSPRPLSFALCGHYYLLIALLTAPHV